MVSMALRIIRAYFWRLALTFIVVMLGVAFVTASFTITDSFTASFNKLFTQLGTGQDAVVGPTATSSNSGPCGTGATIPLNTLDKIENLPGVRSAVATVNGCAQLVDSSGEAIAPSGGAPTIANSWVDDETISPVRLIEGRAPERADEVAIDIDTATDNSLAVGDKVQILSKEPTYDATVVGTVRFGEDNFLLGATLTMLDLDTAQRVLAEPGEVSSIVVAADDGVSQAELVATIKGALGPTFDVQSGDEQVKENQDELSSAFGFMNILLLSFAAIALFVAAFLIANTFAIIMAQRSKEFATMRALGATRRALRGQVSIEATIIGLASGLLGFVLGIGVAFGFYKLLASLGLPDDGLTIKARTLLVATAVGLVVTVLSAVVPAIRASRIPPVEALKGTTTTATRTSWVRIGLGAFLLAIAGLAYVSGAAAEGANGSAAVGAACAFAFLGVFALSPLLVKPVATVVGWPLNRFTAGRIAVRNAIRNPRRTAITASALMIGTALVTLISILGQTVKSITEDFTTNTVTADVVLQNFNLGFSPAAADEVRELPGVRASTAFLLGDAGIYEDPEGAPPSGAASLDEEDRFAAAFGTKRSITGVRLEDLSSTMKLDVVAGDTNHVGPGAILSKDAASDLKRDVGDNLTLYFDRSGKVTVPVVAIVDINDDGISFMEDITIDIETYRANATQLQANVALVAFDEPGSASARAEVDALLKERYPNVETTDAAGFGDDLSEQIDIVLKVITGMLGLSLIIAVLGIVNTLFLSSLERTKEFGLLRAVGAERKDVRAMVTLEAIIVAVLGAVLGIALGLIFALALVPKIFDNEGIDALTIPWGSVVSFLIAAVIAGVVASILPAWRAGRLRVLDAIAYE
jgi:putative ABC transport system permease protein